MKREERAPLLGEVYMVEFTGTGSEQLGRRPAVVFQNNAGNIFSPNVIVLPMTSSLKKMNQPTHVFLSASEVGLRMDSVVLCENPVTVSKSRVGSYITTVPDETMKKIAIGYVLATSATYFLDADDFAFTRERSARLNNVETRSGGSCTMNISNKVS